MKNYSELYRCSIKDYTDHCLKHCLHLHPHLPDECKSYTKCDIVNKNVRCRKLNKKEIKFIMSKN